MSGAISFSTCFSRAFPKDIKDKELFHLALNVGISEEDIGFNSG